MAYAHPLFSSVYDILMLPQEWLGLGRQRVYTVGSAAGRVLELGVGTGLNFPHYRKATEVIGIEPDPYMLKRAEGRAAQAPFSVKLLQSGGEALPFEDASFDAVVASLVFCTIPEAERAAQELRRVLKPDGTFYFLEHVRSPRPVMAHFQDHITPLWKKLFGGCHPNRDTVGLFERQGFTLTKLWKSKSGILVQGSARA